MINKTLFYILSALFLTASLAKAQDMSASVGNPGSSNTMIITNVTGIADTPPNIPLNDFEPLPDSPGVEVAPPPNRIPQDITPPRFSPEPPLEINETISVE